jgi:hypothetical protein
VADYDHHGNLIPAPRHSRAEVKQMMKRHSATTTDERRVHPRWYQPTWEHDDAALTLEEQIGFDLESIQKMRTNDAR